MFADEINRNNQKLELVLSGIYIIVTVVMILHVKEKIYFLQIQNGNFMEEFRKMEFSEESIEYLKENKEYMEKDRDDDRDNTEEIPAEWIEYITAAMIKSGFSLTQTEQLDNDGSKEFSYEEKLFEQINEQYKMIFDDLKYFPIGEDVVGEESISYDNSWYGVRTYGGERVHEGTDIMTSNNVRGYFPVYSMTDGIVEKKGWLRLGGWRIGIRAPSGGYFYYAHLYNYADNLEEGDEVRAGQLLGYVGDSGYSEIEGTVGNFDVHLHLGIYIKDKISGQEISINPYWVLRFLEDKKIMFLSLKKDEIVVQ